ncbi:MAG: methyltransferase domain-containing protein [Chloroflexi bacterium]|nr:methyltransferase domain-containing protein [Chloroflexota bacterium]
MKSPESAAQRSFGRRAAYYTTSATHADPQVLARVVELAMSGTEGLASPKPSWQALDIATGTGHTAFALAPDVAHVLGLDLTPQMLTQAVALRQARSIANVDFCLGDVHRLPFSAESFHLVTCRRAAHHFSDIGQALDEIRRVLRPGGRLVIDDRSVPEDDFLDALMNRLDSYHDESHVQEYRPSHWARMLEQAGFSVKAVEPYIQHRPLTSLTDGASQKNVRRIHRALQGLTPAQRQQLNLAERDGEPHSNHWYLLLSARNG